MSKKLALLLCLFLPLTIQAQKKTIKTDKFWVTYEADWDPTFSGTYHYYVDDDGNTVWHGTASVNQSKNYTDDLYSYGDYVDTYTDTRTLKANANYKEGKLDGLFSLNNSFTLNFKHNRSYNSSFAVSLSMNNAGGIPNGNCKLTADVKLQGNTAKFTTNIIFNYGRVVKYDETGLLNGSKDNEVHLAFDSNGAVTGNYVGEETDIRFKNGYATDRYENLSGYIDDIDAEKREIVQKLADGIINPDSLIDLGYTLSQRHFTNANDNFLRMVNDASFTNYAWWNGGSSPFSSLDFDFWVLKEVRLKSYTEFYSMIKSMDVEQLGKLQTALEEGNAYEGFYLSMQTRNMILDDIPTLKMQARERTRNAARQKVQGKLNSALSGKKYEIVELGFSDNDDLEAITFDVFTDYSTGLGYKTTRCTLSNLGNYLPTEKQVRDAVTNGVMVENGWERVQERYLDVERRNRATLSAIPSVLYEDVEKGYTDYYTAHINNINGNSISAAMSDLDAIYEMQGKYLRLVELKRIILSNHDIIVNMDVKHGDHIIEAYQAYYASLNHTFSSPSRFDEMQQIIDAQTQIIAALRSDNIKKLDKKVKKSDDKSISTVLQLLSSEQ